MRLIDADALKEQLNMGDDCNDCPTDWKSCQYDRVYSKMDFCEWIEDAPTADVRENRKGEWVHCDDGSMSYRCSVCGKHQYGNYSEIFMGEFNFCPNCGADMRTGE